MSRVFIFLQYLIPQHGLSRLVAIVANSRLSFIKNPFIRLFIRRYRVDMNEAKIADPGQYATFNEFFTRELKPGCRPLSDVKNAVLCPADGAISELGPIDDDRLLQAKGRYYSAVELLGGNAVDAEPFRDGNFVTVYLSPRDYHRVHMPLAGTLQKTVYVPGKLFSVNQVTANSVPGLFARNERLVSIFDTSSGPMAVILVGAMIVAGIDTVWAGQACPNKHGLITRSYLDSTPPVQIAGGDEMGRFRLGSTVILLFGPGAVDLQKELHNGCPVKMGEMLGTITRNTNST